MKVTLFIKKASALVAAFGLVGTFVFASQVSAVPYDPNHPGASTPTFNMYTGTPSVGDESDFLRGKEEGSTGYVDTVNSACGDGQKFTLRVYVHNGANQAANNGGSGPSVARGTKVRVQLPNSATDRFSLNSTISANNAPSVSDGMTINCNGQVRRISYVAGTAQQYTVPGGTQALSDSIVTTGAAVGTNQPNGDVWGCWDQRVWVTLTVKVEVVPEPPVPQTAVCTMLSELVRTNRTVRVSDIDYTLTGAAAFRSYSINWGDGTSTNNFTTFPQEHVYAGDGTFTVRASVNVTVNGQNTTVTSANCAKSVTIETDSPDITVCELATKNIITINEKDFDASKHTRDLSKCETPVTPPTPQTPTVLPDTGVGAILGLFAAVTAGGTIAHRFVLGRRSL